MIALRRHLNLVCGQRGAALIGLLLALVISGFLAWYVLNTYLGSSAEPSGAEIGLSSPMDHTSQQRTISDMQAIGRAITMAFADTGEYPANLAKLQERGYFVRVPAADAWGGAWTYTTGRDGYQLVSLGADGRAGPAPPSPWTSGSYESDLILKNGQLTQAPGR